MFCYIFRGQFEYELVLKTDLYTNRHTQWYYFRVSNAVPGVVYRFRIVNLLKRDSLYNYGMYRFMVKKNVGNLFYVLLKFPVYK